MIPVFVYTRLFRSAVNFVAEYLLVLFFFQNVEEKEEHRWSWAGYLVMAIIAVLYFQPAAHTATSTVESWENILTQCARLGIYWLAVFGFLRIRKNISFIHAVHATLFYTVLYLMGRNLKTNLEICMRFSLMREQGEGLIRLGMNLAVIAVEYLLAYGIRRRLPWGSLKATRPIAAILLIANFLELYFKFSLITMQEVSLAAVRPVDAVAYPLCATAGIMLLCVLVEVNSYEQEERRKLELEKISANYENKNTIRLIQNDQDIRRLYHDMKNHLLALRTLEDRDGERNRYLSNLLEDLSEYENHIKTGNPVIDAMLFEKWRSGREKKIQFHVYADLRKLEFMRPADLVVILGNAVDNAIEAVGQLENPEERIIYIKEAVLANMDSICVSNAFTGEVKQSKGHLISGKANSELHGIGLKSIRKAAERYHGFVNTEFDNQEKWFRLTVLIPLKKQSEKSGERSP